MPRRDKPVLTRYPTFTCVGCGLENSITPSHWPTNYHPDVVAQGKRKPGPHCKRCANRFYQEQMAKIRQEAYDREAARQKAFNETPRPDDVDTHTWYVMRTYACCPKARKVDCYCMHSFSCPEHGVAHIGTHD